MRTLDIQSYEDGFEEGYEKGHADAIMEIAKNGTNETFPPHDDGSTDGENLHLGFVVGQEEEEDGEDD